MALKPKLSHVVGGLCMSMLVLASANASTVSYSGTLGADDQVQLYSYNLAQGSNVIFSTNSYGGGVTNGMTVAAGGFVPVVSLFDSMGNVVGSDGGDAICSGAMHSDSATGMCDDATLNENLAAGNYTLAVTEFFNVPVGPNISNGFLMQGQGNFTGATCGATGGFYETDIAPCVQRTNSFSLSATTTPEPSTLWLAALPLIFIGVSKRRSSRTQII